MSTDGRLRLATRSSDLAMYQAGTIQETLADHRQDTELVTVETTGDRVTDELIHRLGKTGAFVRSLDEKVLDGDVDAAVHSMKDVPTEEPPELVIAAVPERAPQADVLVTPDGKSLADLPAGATVGTSSLRRAAQIRAERPELTIEPLRGNVDTRVEKVLAPSLIEEHERRLEAAEDDEEGESGHYDRTPEKWFDDLAEIERQAMEREVDVEYDAIVLAEAGLARSGLLRHLSYERLSREQFVPAPGQGAVAVTARDGPTAEDLRGVLDDEVTRVETTVERTILAELGGGCIAPLGIDATVQGTNVMTRVQVLSQDGTEIIERTRDLPIESHREAAVDMAMDCADAGAASLIQEARKRAGEEDSV